MPLNFVFPILTPLSPFISHKGHMFCKQCIYQNLLEQKKANKKKLKKWEEANKIEDQRSELQKRLDTQAKLEAFQKQESSLLSASISSKPSVNSEPQSSTKSWWMPEEAPQHSSSSVAKPSQDTLCPRTGHVLRVKELVAVDFKRESKPKRAKDDEDISPPTSSDWICYMCNKDLKSISKVIMIKVCGHAICFKCSDEFAKKKCPVCETLCDEDGEKILLQPPASSFAEGGATIATKSTPAPRIM
jgi:nitric oxide synthase-interacting protein